MRAPGWGRVGVVAVLTVIVAAVTAIGAQAAKPTEHFPWYEEIDVVAERCGVAVHIEGNEGGTVLARAPGADQIPRFTVKWRGDVTWTNVATGKTFMFVWRLAEQEVKSVDNGDGTLTLLYQYAGPEHVYGPDGKRVYLWVGMARERVLIDHGGTPTDPSDDTFISEDFLQFRGRPDRGGEFCATFTQLTG